MKKLFTKCRIALILSVVFSISELQSQSLQSSSANIINDITPHAMVFSPVGVSGKTATCGVDTVNYAWNKTSAFLAISLNATTSGNTFAQWYPAPQPITVTGFDFYAWAPSSPTPVTLTCNLYNAGTDSMPIGAPLRTITVSVDSTFGGGLLSALRKRAVFPTPITTSVPYVITLETSSSTNVSVITNSWTATTPNGRSQWLSSVKIGTTFYRGYNVNIGGVQFNADFILQPYVSYSLTAGFTPSACNAGGNLITFTNTSSPAFFSPFYNRYAFYGIQQSCSVWDYGDTSGTWYAVNGTRTYNYRIPYTVKLRDTLYGWTIGCGDQTTSTLTASPRPPVAASNSPLCNGATIRLTADTIPGVTYYWTGPNGFSSTLQNPTIPGAAVSMIGNYSVVAVIGQCSSLVATTSVNVITTPSATNNGPLCAGQTLNLSVTNISGAVYAWTGPNGFSSALQAPVKTGTTVADSGIYSVTVTLAGCGTIGPYTTSAIVNRVPNTPTVTNNGPLCVGNNLNLTSSAYAGGTYSWTGPNGFTSSQQNPTIPVVLNSYAGSYTVTITANGCTSGAGSTTVTINNVPGTPTAGNNGPLCGGQSLSLTATAIAGATYSWSGPNGFTSTSQNPTRSPITTADAGNYSVIATVNGCPSQAGVTYVAITTLTPTPVAASNGPLCPGQNLQLTASSVPGATYAWTGPNSFTSTQQNPTISNVSAATNAGIYSVTATTSGCGTSSPGNVNLIINPSPPAPTAGNNGPLCTGDSIKLTSSTITGASYSWTGPNGFSSSSQNPFITNANSFKAGQYSVFVTVTGCGTSPTANTTVVTHEVPATPTASSNAPVCSGDSLKFSATSFGVGPNATYKWSGPNGFNSTLKNPIILNGSTSHNGSYSLSVSDSGCTSATASTSVLVKSIPAAPFPTSNGPICEGANLLLYSSAISGATYSWSGPNNYKSSVKDPLITAAPASASGTYSVSSIVNGCTSLPASLTVIVNALPATPIASNNGPKCIGDNISLSASTVAGATYSWSGPAGFTSTLQNPVLTNITTTMAGTYSVIAISSTCSSPAALTYVIVNTFPSPPVLSSYPTSGVACVGDSVVLYAGAVSGATYDWTGPAGFGSSLQNPIIKNLTSANGGTYSAKLTKGGCASNAATINISINQLPATGPITGPTTVNNNDTQTYTVTGSPGSVYNWVIVGGNLYNSGSAPTIKVIWSVASTTASVSTTETNAGGCKGTLKQLNVTILKTGVIENMMEAGTVSMYPNPAVKNVNFDFDMKQSCNTRVELVNMIGQTVMSSSYNINKKDQVSLDISSLRSGIYIVNIIVGDERKTMKLTVE